jgi:hypothetical protein
VYHIILFIKYFLIVFTRSDLDYLLISLLERMKHVVGDAHWHSPMAYVSVVIISKRAVSEGLGSGPIIISFPTSLHSLSSSTCCMICSMFNIAACEQSTLTRTGRDG